MIVNVIPSFKCFLVYRILLVIVNEGVLYIIFGFIHQLLLLLSVCRGSCPLCVWFGLQIQQTNTNTTRYVLLQQWQTYIDCNECVVG